MRIFVAGGSGTIGVPLVRTLVAAGHQVTALTRSEGKRDQIRALGASVAVADALNREELTVAVRAARPTHVIHELTALPKDGAKKASDIEPTNRLRIDGTRNLIEAAVLAGARRFVAGSFAPLAPVGAAGSAVGNAAAEAVRSMEDQVLEASARGLIEGLVLRYGLFYGLEAPSTVALIDMVRKRRLPIVRGDAGQLPFIHVEDAVRATVLALAAGRSGEVYDIVDDQALSMSDLARAIAQYTGSPAPMTVPGWLPRLIAPFMARMMRIQMPLSNAKAKAELGWRPQYATVREGLARMFEQAA